MNNEQRLFLEDARDIVDKLYADLAELRIEGLEGRRRRRLAAQIFRRVHTLKGSAASLGHQAISQVAHEFEAVLDASRLGLIELERPVLDTFEGAVAAIERVLDSNIEHDVDGQMIVQRLAEISNAAKTQSGIAGDLRAALPAELAVSLSEYDVHHAREAISEGAKLFIVSAGFSLESFDSAFRELTKLLGEGGEVIATAPGAPATEDELTFRIVYAAEFISNELLRRAATLARISHEEITLELPAKTITTSGDAVPLLNRSVSVSDRSPIRLDESLLDELIATAGELFRQTNNVLARVPATTGSGIAESTIKDVRMRFVAFEDRLIKLRLAPATEVLERAARAGRVAARHLAKDVEFRISAADVGIERSLATIIADPLLHLVRNAITHGIESCEERRLAGKNPKGLVTLAAYTQSGRIYLTVTDDGRGIDLDQVITAAGEHGIAGTQLTEEQCLRLIFRPGFSTSRAISDLSGRGIGLDVVDRAMDAAGGEVRVATERGKGSTFAMIVPAALSLVNCLIVRCGAQFYAIDTSHVQVTTSVGSFEPQHLPLVRLAMLTGQATAAGEPNQIFVWHRPGQSNGAAGVPGYRIGVDEIVATQETLVRGLGRHAYRWTGVAGAAEMLDGNVALALDLSELITATLENVP